MPLLDMTLLDLFAMRVRWFAKKIILHTSIDWTTSEYCYCRCKCGCQS